MLARTGGPAGNARLTSWLGVVLLVAFAVEGFTLLSLHSMLAVHIFVGTLLVPLALAKTATTTWRMVRYYLRNKPYRVAGPPPMLLRVLGPAVVVTTLAVLGTGLALIAVGRGHQMLFSHKATFVLWLAVMSVHVLGRILAAIVILTERRFPQGVPGGWWRAAAMSCAVTAGVVAGLLVLPYSNQWTHRF